MLNAQFIGLNLHFAVNLLAALVCFGVFWLIFDAWTIRRSRVELAKWLGFLLLSIGFLLRASALHGQAADFTQYTYYLAGIFRLIGYALIAIGQIFDPLMERPVYVPEPDLEPTPPSPSPPAAPLPEAGPEAALPTVPPPSASAPGISPPDNSAAKPKPHHAVAHHVHHVPVTKPGSKKAQPKHSAFFLGPIVGFILPLLAGLIATLYWRRATTGLERHLKPVALGFATLTLFELLGDIASIQGITNPNLYQLVATFGPVWWASLAALLTASIILGTWVWRYLVKRIQSQLFILLVTQTLVIFLISTIGFTFLLLRNIETQSLADLSTASHVLDYAISSRQAETAAQAEAVAAKTAVATAIAARDHKSLVATLTSYMSDHSLTTLTITDGSGQVLLRGEDPSRWGDSRSSDQLVRLSLIGEARSSVVVKSGVVAPTVTLVAASPVRDTSGTIVGAVTAGRTISNAFVDGIRSSTGLDSAVYGADVRAATTLVSQNGTDRAIGIKEASTTVTTQVLKKDKSYSGPISLQNRAYLGAYTPLRDVNNVPVGMLLVARPQDSLYAAANQSVQLTFLFVVLLVFLSVYPIYLISRYLSRQLK